MKGKVKTIAKVWFGYLGLSYMLYGLSDVVLNNAKQEFAKRRAKSSGDPIPETLPCNVMFLACKNFKETGKEFIDWFKYEKEARGL